MHFVLVHGAWHGGWCYEHLANELHARHLGVSALDLPGHGDDRTPLTEVTLDRYVDHVQRWILELDRPVELVGHSMAGIIISAVAEKLPSHITGLSYVCAFLPRSGDSLAELGREDEDSALNGAIRSGAEPGTVIVSPEDARAIFYHDCRQDDIDAAVARLGPQPVAPFAAPVMLTDENFGRVPRGYVACTEDRAISIAMQRRMLARVPCAPVVELTCGHSPFYSHPIALADALIEIAGSRTG